MRIFVYLSATVSMLLAPVEHVPLHKGSIDLPTGLYVRVNDDLVLQGAPVLALRRTYLSGDRVSRVFGIGTTHPGDEYLIGDGETFQHASLILARGSRINFTRVTPGNTILNARYVHEETAGEWQGAELSWIQVAWSVKKRDGSVLLFKGCGKATTCSILQSTDAHGRTVYYRRNLFGRLMKIESGTRWIALEYDAAGRIERAHDSTKRGIRYTYDSRGRLERVTTSEGAVFRYTYTGLDELETIEEPGTSITNAYDGGRCVRQVNWFPDRDPYVFELKYQVEGRTVHRTRISESNGTWREYAWDDRKSAMSELVGRAGAEPAFIMYEREAPSRALAAFTLSCRGRDGQPLRQRIPVKDGEADLLKRALVSKLCS